MVLKKDKSKVFGMEGKVEVCLLYIPSSFFSPRRGAFNERERENTATSMAGILLVNSRSFLNVLSVLA